MITTRGDFDREIRIVDALVDRNAKLPEQVFRPIVVGFHLFDFDRLWTEELFSDAQSLAARAGDPLVTFAVLEPHPETYYYAHFSKFPLLQFGVHDAPDRYVASLHEDPGGSPADAVAYNSETLLIYSPSRRWAMYGDRNLEIGIRPAIAERIRQVIRSKLTQP